MTDIYNIFLLNGIALLFFKDLFTFICEYTIAFFRHSEERVQSYYRWLWTTMWLLSFELRTSRTAFSVLNYWAIAPPYYMGFLYDVFYLSVENWNNSQHYNTKCNYFFSYGVIYTSINCEPRQTEEFPNS